MSKKVLHGKVALVSGAGRGIGAATVRLLADAGCALALLARDESWLEMAATEARRRGGKVELYAVDVADVEDVRSAVEAAEAVFGKIDIVVNAVGAVLPLDLAVEADAEEWAYAVHVNMIGPFSILNAVLPGMMERGYGRIVNLTCGSSTRASPGESAYRSAKAGLETWTEIVSASWSIQEYLSPASIPDR